MPEMLARIRAHASEGLVACGGETAGGIVAWQLKRAKPQLRNEAAQAMMQGTTAMLGVVEAWSDDLAETISGEVSRREDALQQLVQSCVEYSAGEVSAFMETAAVAAAAERKEAMSELKQSLTSKAVKEHHTLTHALNTKLESATHQLQVQKEAFVKRTQELEAQNKELEARLVVSEEKLVAAGRREEVVKAAGQERLKASNMGRDALQTRIRRLERELKGEKELRVSLQSRSAAAKALWGKASDEVSSGALWTRLANAAAEQEQPNVKDIEAEELVQRNNDSDPAVQANGVASDTPTKSTARPMCEIEQVATPSTSQAPSATTPQPTTLSCKAAAGSVSVSPIFESPGGPGLGSPAPTAAAKDGKRSNGAVGADARGPSFSASTQPVSQRRHSLGGGIERLAASRPRSALSLRRERSLRALDRTKSASATTACSAKPRLQRRASTSAIKNGSGSGFMKDTAASGARANAKGTPQSRHQGRMRVALGVRVQGLAADSVAPQFDRGGFPLP